MEPKIDFEEIREWSTAAHQRNIEFYEFNRDTVFPLVTNIPNDESFPNALKGTYLRAYYFLCSLIKLDKQEDFQAVLSISRSLFELYLDIVALINDPSCSQKYHAFGSIDRMKWALRVSKYDAEHPNSHLAGRYPYLVEIAKDPRHIAACEKSLKEVFGIEVDIKSDGAKKFPSNWTGIEQIRQRAEKNPTSHLFYLSEYAKASWFVHSGNTGINHVSLEQLMNFWGTGHDISRRLILNIVHETCREMRLEVPIDSVAKFSTDLPGR